MILPKATAKQIEYIEILSNDIGIKNVKERNAYIETTINRQIRDLDELFRSEASEIIKRMKEDKEEDRAFEDDDFLDNEENFRDE